MIPKTKSEGNFMQACFLEISTNFLKTTLKQVANGAFPGKQKFRIYIHRDCSHLKIIKLKYFKTIKLNNSNKKT